MDVDIFHIGKNEKTKKLRPVFYGLLIATNTNLGYDTHTGQLIQLLWWFSSVIFDKKDGGVRFLLFYNSSTFDNSGQYIIIECLVAVV